ncbi:hypothetical protein BsWGS_25966 [Bradybaena similaris]
MMYKHAVLLICAVLSAGNCADIQPRQQSDGFVGFYVSLNESKTFTPGQTVKYNNVFTNAGNHYDPTTGVFTAPRTAYYLFHIHALTNGVKGFWFQLIHNEIPRASCGGDSPTSWLTGGNSALLKVKACERVYVKAAFSLPSHVFGDGTQHYTTFTGVMAGQ